MQLKELQRNCLFEFLVERANYLAPFSPRWAVNFHILLPRCCENCATFFFLIVFVLLFSLANSHGKRNTHLPLEKKKRKNKTFQLVSAFDSLRPPMIFCRFTAVPQCNIFLLLAAVLVCTSQAIPVGMPQVSCQPFSFPVALF